MSAGTLTLTNNSATVSGTGTSFTSELATGDFIVVTVGGVPYTLPVKSANSATSLTLVSNFTGPTQSGAAWSAVPRVALNMVTAALVAQSAEALRGLNYDKQNWQQVFSGSGTITVKLPDGSTFSGPSWKYLSDNMATKSGGAVPINQGGTGGTTSAEARQYLGLGTAATLNANTTESYPTSGVLTVGQYGIGAFNAPLTTDFNSIERGGIYAGAGATGINFYNIYGPVLVMSRYSASAMCAIQADATTVAWNIKDASGWRGWAKLYGERNTIKASDGTLKAASPIVQIFSDGSFHLNDESEGCTVTRLAVGEYLIDGCMGLNADAAWGGIDGGFDVPTDRNKQPLIWLDYEVNADGSVLVKTYHRTHPGAPAFARNLIGRKNDSGEFIESVEDGDAIDIPADQFVSVRVEMSVDSVYNRRLLESTVQSTENESK